MGSPPHTRGKGLYTGFVGFPGGITPAHAGKRSWQTPPGWAGGDHPRTRGEKWPMFSKLKPSSGSPPHTRGKGTLETQEKHMDRITPAHAGKRCAFPNVWEDVKDHPRTRGEKSAVKEAVAPVAGITPAHAGKRNRQCNLQVCRWDHPRTRGEKGNMPEKFNELLGSPPHTRGKDIYILAISFHSRITPAHAGKRRWGCSLRRPPRDHPRTRGEKLQNIIDFIVNVGSPPHTRGKGLHVPDGQVMGRITPAHAGKRLNGSRF